MKNPDRNQEDEMSMLPQEIKAWVEIFEHKFGPRVMLLDDSQIEELASLTLLGFPEDLRNEANKEFRRPVQKIKNGLCQHNINPKHCRACRK